MHSSMVHVRRTLGRMANDAGQLPGIRLLARPLYRRLFQRPFQPEMHYYGVYGSYEEALRDAPETLPTTYDVDAAGRMYRSHLAQIRVSDYPVVHWLSRLMAAGQRRVFDLGGHIGLSYYGFQRYLDYPADLRWTVHDVPAVVTAGREWAAGHDPNGRLTFTVSPQDADGTDVLFTSGALQYLDYTLAEMLAPMPSPPAHVLINMVPMHPSRSYFTLQNIGFAICPYRISSVSEFVDSMEALGYRIVDRWESHERHLEVPFAPDYDIDRYYGYYFRHESAARDELTRHVAHQQAARSVLDA